MLFKISGGCAMSLFFGSSTLPEVAKTIFVDIVATLSHASTSLKSSMDARASEHQVRDIKEFTSCSALTVSIDQPACSRNRH